MPTISPYVPPAYLSAVDPAEVRVDLRAHQPTGAYGFRKGMWTVLYQGRRYRVFANPPHQLEIAAQHRIVEVGATRTLGLLFHDMNREG